MNVVIVTEKPWVSQALAPRARTYWPTAKIVFAHLTPYANFKPVYPRGLRTADYPRVSPPGYRLQEWDSWFQPPLSMSHDGTLSPTEMRPELFTQADLIVYACDPCHTGAMAFELLVTSILGKDHTSECPALVLSALDDESIGQAFTSMQPFGQAFAKSLEYGRMKQFFDWNWNMNALAVLGVAQRMAGVPSEAPPLSKYALQLLYGLRNAPVRAEAKVLSLMQNWPGTGRYVYQPGEHRPRLGGFASTYQIVENLMAAGLLERSTSDGLTLLGLAERGIALLNLLHPDCEDPDLPFRLDAWCHQGAAATPAVDRYLKTFFGKQLRVTSTGRVSRSEPDIQHFPGTPQALAQSRRMKAALAQGPGPFIDFSGIEDRAIAAEFMDYLKSKD